MTSWRQGPPGAAHPATDGAATPENATNASYGARVSTPSTGRHRLLAAVIVETAPALAAEPAGLDVFHQQRAGPVLRIGETLVEHLHHREAGIEPDEIRELERAHRMVGAEPHRRIDCVDRADAFIERVDGLVDHRQQNAVDDEGGKILGRDRSL